jgi:hypothetical protein
VLASPCPSSCDLKCRNSAWINKAKNGRYTQQILDSNIGQAQSFDLAVQQNEGRFGPQVYVLDPNAAEPRIGSKTQLESMIRQFVEINTVTPQTSRCPAGSIILWSKRTKNQFYISGRKRSQTDQD